jgi:hypothetical protein
LLAGFPGRAVFAANHPQQPKPAAAPDALVAELGLPIPVPDPEQLVRLAFPI